MVYIEFKKGEKYASKGADTSDTLDNFNDAGYLLKEEDVIIDIDCLDKKVIQKMIQYFNIKTQIVWTDRGCHLYYHKNEGFTRGGNRVCALGFPIEIKTSKNTKNGITIKRNGIIREIENEGTFEELPLLFYKNKKFNNLIGYGESDGRNNALFVHRQRLQNMNAWEKVLRFINNFIFEVPLDEKEYQTITRDMDLNISNYDEYNIASMLITELNTVVFNGEVWFYKDGEYHNNVNLLKRFIYTKVENKPTRFVDEIVKQLEYRSKLIVESTFDIKFNNGILRQGKFIEVNSLDFTPYSIEIDYKKNAEPVQMVDDYINKLTNDDENYRNLLLECLAHCLITDAEFKRLLAKFFIFRGDGSNGKGTLLQIIQKILGSQNCTTLSLKNMEDERYAVTMKGKLANLGDDVESSPINDKQMAIIKSVATCDTNAMRQLYKQSENMTMTLSMIFTSNHNIKSFEKGDAFKRRIMWLPMFVRIEDKDKDPLFITKLTSKESLEYWIKLIVDAYFRLYKNKKFTKSVIVEAFNDEYHKENNPYLQFLQDVDVETLLGLSIGEVKDAYNLWAEENCENILKGTKLLKETLKKEYNMGFVVKRTNKMTRRLLERLNKTSQKI